MLTMLLMALAMQSPPACKLPDLNRTDAAFTPDHRAQLLESGVLSVSMTDPVADTDERLPGIPSEAPPAGHSEHSVWLWSEASDWLLVPKGLEVSVARVGVDGSWIIELADPKAPDRRLRATSTGACVGCAYSAGAAYFASYASAARDNEFEFCRGLERPIVRDQETAHRLRFHYDNPAGKRQDAVAAINADEINFTELTVSGLDSAVRDEILAAFAPGD